MISLNYKRLKTKIETKKREEGTWNIVSVLNAQKSFSNIYRRKERRL